MAIKDDWRVDQRAFQNAESDRRRNAGSGRTADINRDLSYENLADDLAGLLDYLNSAKGCSV